MSEIEASARKRNMRWLVLGGAFLATGFLFAAPPAQAGVFVHFGFGVPVFVGPPVIYGPPAYYGPPVYYQPPVYYSPPPANAPPADYSAQSGSSSSAYCREYQSTARINGTAQRTHGTACQQPDGSWQIVN